MQISIGQTVFYKRYFHITCSSPPPHAVLWGKQVVRNWSAPINGNVYRVAYNRSDLFVTEITEQIIYHEAVAELALSSETKQ
jgi:hypothetical protein